MLISGTNIKTGEPFEYIKCECEDRALAKQAVETHKRMLHRKAMDIFKQHSLMNDTLKNCTFYTYDPFNKSQESALEASLYCLGEVSKGKPFKLILSGLYGLGKSHLAAAITHALLDKGFNCIFVDLPQLLRKIRSTYSNRAEVTEDQLLQALEQADFVVLDDLGAENTTDWAADMVFSVVNGRAGKSTCVTTNLSVDELKKHSGGRNASRLIHDATLVEMQGTDYRQSTVKIWGQ